MLVRQPGRGGRTVEPGLASLEDVTATLLALAGVERPAYYDSVPLSGLGLEGAGRQRVFGFLGDGTMNFDGTHKWVKYSSGEQLLFEPDADPQEQTNLADTDAGRDIARRLDAELTRELMRSIAAAHTDLSIGHEPLWDSDAFGRPGWHRRYPQPLAPS